MRIAPFLLSIFAVCLFAAAAPASAQPADPPDGLPAAMHEYLSRAAEAGFGGSVLVARGGQVVLHRAYGWADPDAAVPMDTAMPFYVASLSKGFTAAAILRLEMEGRLSTADSISRWLPAVPADKRGITLHHLLTHTSGLRDPADGPPLDRDAFTAAVLALPARSAPGERYGYSNAGYSLLAAVVERASGRPFEEYMRDAIFRPAGMTRTSLVTDAPSGSPESWPVALNGTLRHGGPWMVHHRPYGWAEVGGTGVVTTTGDLYRWVRALEAGTVLSAEAWRKLWTPALEDYAYGWGVRRTARGRTIASHDGTRVPEGWNAQIRVYPQDSLVIVVLSSTRVRTELSAVVGRALDRLALGGDVSMPPATRPLPRAAAERFAGTYVLPSGAAFRLTVDGAGRLMLEPLGQAAADLMLYPGDTVRGRHAPDSVRAATLFQSLAREDWAAVGVLAGRPEAEWRPRLERTWRWMRERWGVFHGAEVVNTAPGPFEGAGEETFVRLVFERHAPVVRVTWDGDAFLSMSDEGAFDGVAQSVPPVPGPVPLAWQGGADFAAFDLASAQRVNVLFEVDDAGHSTAVRVGGGDPAVRVEPPPAAPECAPPAVEARSNSPLSPAQRGRGAG
ncbi:MAG TPA: serine hydrolase domain-containing protein, partial [Longimicrobium sp.]|nr:serine hydrolase domain-containing protein [Longimicrobium sp.]